MVGVTLQALMRRIHGLDLVVVQLIVAVQKPLFWLRLIQHVGADKDLIIVLLPKIHPVQMASQVILLEACQILT